jgi:FkbM family methyltransferase
MSTTYFILTKHSADDVARDENNQLVFLNSKASYILPANNLPYYIQHGLFEKGLIQWCKQFCKQGTILDIGAHTGTYSIALAPHASSVHSFEPQKMTYYALCGSIALSNSQNVTAHNVALGAPDQVGKMTLNIRSHDGGGSSLQSFADPVIAQEQVEVRTLDSYNFRNITFIKMDVEDNELNVLKGAAQTIKQNNYPTIIFESNHENQRLFSYIIDTLGYGAILPINGVSNMFLTDPPKNQNQKQPQPLSVQTDPKSYYESLGIRK